jgi:hypothetical protein
MTKQRWIAPALGALVGATAWPIAAGLTYGLDEGTIQLPHSIESLVVGLWLALSLPGAILAGKGYLTAAIITIFWSFCFGYLARLVNDGWCYWKYFRIRKD